MRQVIPAVLILACFLLPATPVAAQPAEDTAAPAVSAEPAPRGDSSAPVPVPEPSDKAMRYYRSGNVLWVIGTLWGFAVPCLLLFTGFSARLRDAAHKIGRKRFFTIAVYGILFTLVTFVLDLPLAFYQDFVRQHAYGLSDQSAAKWWSDAFKALAVSCVFIALILWFPYWLLRKSPRRWWLYTGLATAPLLALLLFVTPIWIEPLFNQFGPMKDKALEAKILALADRAGIEGSRVYEVNKSVDTKTVNAYVTGFLKTKRIVLWDTILAKLSDREVLLVMGHEMGHYVLGHVPQLIALGTALALLGLWVIHRTAGGLIARYRDRFGFSELSDVASLPLIALLFSLVTFVLSPAVLAFTRHNEHEADRFGLEITRDNHDCATAFVKLQQENLSNPRPGRLFKLWRSSHPPLGERIDFCNGYRPWEKGEPLAYGDLMRGPRASPFGE
ncbi:MAG TPA: M48 family metallopeptidase [Thermoanaerobaculia bacterium]|jgi:Zn-dependent protease with chaperone function|nr:M48 family metallopeptidase [Thermoanaerobaculia bacterium]